MNCSHCYFQNDEIKKKLENEKKSNDRQALCNLLLMLPIFVVNNSIYDTILDFFITMQFYIYV